MKGSVSSLSGGNPYRLPQQWYCVEEMAEESTSNTTKQKKKTHAQQKQETWRHAR